MKKASLIFPLLLLIGSAFTQERDYVPDEKTAVAIAEAVLIPIYGRKHIESERPFKAKLKDGIWYVNGTLHCGKSKQPVDEICVGGAAAVQLAKRDGRIIEMVHYK
jgi:hypothetical protein